MQGLKIGTVASRADVGVETVRFYERQGLIKEPPRTSSGYRQYPEETIVHLQFIRRAQEVGFSLREIDELISLKLDPSADRPEVKARAEGKVAEIEAKIRDLQRMKNALTDLVGACNGHGSVRECPILEAMDGAGTSDPRP